MFGNMSGNREKCWSLFSKAKADACKWFILITAKYWTDTVRGMQSVGPTRQLEHHVFDQSDYNQPVPARAVVIAHGQASPPSVNA